jgi:hypothetical protein
MQQVNRVTAGRAGIRYPRAQCSSKPAMYASRIWRAMSRGGGGRQRDAGSEEGRGGAGMVDRMEIHLDRHPHAKGVVEGGEVGCSAWTRRSSGCSCTRAIWSARGWCVTALWENRKSEKYKAKKLRFCIFSRHSRFWILCFFLCERVKALAKRRCAYSYSSRRTRPRVCMTAAHRTRVRSTVRLY